MKLGAVKAKGMTKLCPNSTCGFILLTYTHSQLTHVLTILCITSSHTLPLHIIPGSSLRGGGVFDPAPSQALGRTQEGSVVGWFSRESHHRSPKQVQGKGPSEATSCSKSKPSIQTNSSLLPAWHLFHHLGRPAPSPATLLPVYSIYIIYIYLKRCII